MTKFYTRSGLIIGTVLLLIYFYILQAHFFGYIAGVFLGSILTMIIIKERDNVEMFAIERGVPIELKGQDQDQGIREERKETSG